MTLNASTKWDAQYNNRALVPEHGEYLARWARESDLARRQLRCVLDQPYGSGPNETLDVFLPDQPRAPVLVFLHGGYWRSLDKADHSFVAPPFVGQGACVVVPNYALCPQVSVSDIVNQMAQALVWVYRNIQHHGGDRQRVTLVGHSAGAQLAAMLLAWDWAQEAPDLPEGWCKRAVGVSGVYDLEPLRHTSFLQPVLQLTEEEVARVSPCRQPPPPQAQLACWVGGAESEAFWAQNRLMLDAWGPQHVPVCESVAQANHFSVLDALVQTQSGLHQCVSKWLWA
jgi:arylformamidase